MDLLDFLRARLDEDEQLARACIAEVGDQRVGEPYHDVPTEAVERDDFPSYPWGSQERELAYMAGPGHPSRVLREVAAVREIIRQYCGEVERGPAGERNDFQARHGGILDAYRAVLRIYSATYSDHPDYPEAQ